MGKIKQMMIDVEDGQMTIDELLDLLEEFNTMHEEESESEEESVLDQRAIYGSFKDKASWIQSGKEAMRNCPSWDSLRDAEREALDNILQKMGRILYGTGLYLENYRDIAGYSTLILREFADTIGTQDAIVTKITRTEDGWE